MKIYTRTGDKGETSLLGGGRVSKADLRIEAYGTVDELNAVIGLLRASTSLAGDDLLDIQHQLFNIGSLLAADKGLKRQLPQLSDDAAMPLEQAIDSMESNLPELKNFVLPGGNIPAAHAHVARTVCRRAERRVVALEDEFPTVVLYLNRLSDYLFVLSRALVYHGGDEEIIWKA